MPKSFSLKIVTPQETVYEGGVFSLVAPAELGYLGVLADHAPLVAKLVSGKIIIRDSLGEAIRYNSVARGYLEVLKNNVTMILEKLA